MSVSFDLFTNTDAWKPLEHPNTFIGGTSSQNGVLGASSRSLRVDRLWQGTDSTMRKASRCLPLCMAQFGCMDEHFRNLENYKNDGGC